jgi:tetratricopeptide (TPR) repeat protein
MSNGEQTWEVEFPSAATGYEMHIPLSERKAQSPSDQLQWSSENLTAADRELIEEMRRQNPQMREEGIFVNGESASGPDSDQSGGGDGEGTSAGEQGGGSSDSAGSGDNQDGSDQPAPRLEKRGGSGQAGGNESGSSSEKSKKKGSTYKPSYLLGIQEVRDLYSRGNYELAMVRLKKLEEAYPGDVKLLTMKGTLWMKLGRASLARKAWEQVLQIDPDNQQVIQALQRLERRQSSGGAAGQGQSGR